MKFFALGKVGLNICRPTLLPFMEDILESVSTLSSGLPLANLQCLAWRTLLNAPIMVKSELYQVFRILRSLSTQGIHKSIGHQQTQENSIVVIVDIDFIEKL